MMEFSKKIEILFKSTYFTQTIIEKHAKNHMNKHYYVLNLLVANINKDIKKKIYFLNMKVDCPPFGGHETKQHLKHYNSQMIFAKSNYALWFK